MNLALLFNLLNRARKQLFQVGVIAAMAAIGLWGHKTHWQFSAHADSRFDSPRGSDSDSSARPAAVPRTRIQFPTAKSVEELGIVSQLAEHRQLSREIVATGMVTYDPARLAQLSARAPGTVWRVEKQVGQTIRSGDVLAIVDAPAVGQAKADFLHALADVELREKAVERLQSFGNGEIPGKQIEEAGTALRKARVDRFNAQQALISLGLAVKVQEWEKLSEDDLKRRIKFLGLPESVVSELDPNATTATLLPILAPFGGLVIGRDLSLGEVVSPTQNQLEIADISRMWIVLDVRGQDADELELGQQVVFVAGKTTVTSKLSWMSTAVDPKTRTIEVRCEVDNPAVPDSQGNMSSQRLLRANLFGEGTIQLRQNPSALVVPTKAVQRGGELPVVFVRTDERSFEARTVRVGIVTPEISEILEGLSSSEPVAVEGSHILRAELQRSADAN